MQRKQRIAWTALLFPLLLATVLFWRTPRIFGQAATGYQLLATTANGATVTYTDATCPGGQTCSYEVTAVNSAVTPSTESGPSNIVSATAGPLGQIVLSWTPGATSATSNGVTTTYATPTAFKVYTASRSVPTPNPPSGLAAVSK